MQPVAQRPPTHDRAPETADGPAFEQALAEVESIIQRIEEGQLGLEEQIAQYERGVRLLRRCRDVLTKAEQRVQEIDAELGRLDDAKRGDAGS